MSVDVPVGTVRWNLAEPSGSDIVAINSSLERMVSLVQTVVCMVVQQLDKEVRFSDHPRNIIWCIREEAGPGSGYFCGTSCETCGDSRGDPFNNQTQQCFIGRRGIKKPNQIHMWTRNYIAR